MASPEAAEAAAAAAAGRCHEAVVAVALAVVGRSRHTAAAMVQAAAAQRPCATWLRGPTTAMWLQSFGLPSRCLHSHSLLPRPALPFQLIQTVSS